MNIKALLGIVNRPWFIEPGAAHYYSNYASSIFRGIDVPQADRRFQYNEDNDDRRPLFRVNKSGVPDPNGEIQVIRVIGPIAKYDLCGTPGTQSFQQIIYAANLDPSISSIVIWFDSPGGQVDGTESLANAIKASSKVIVAYSDSMICSAAYWLASSAKEIVVHGANDGWNAKIGSIGTMCYWEDYSGKYEKEGIKVHTVFATKSKDKWGDYFKRNSSDDDAYNKLISELDGLNESFLSAVSNNRNGKLHLDKEDVLSGKTYNAKDALSFGLIDFIADFQYAIERAQFLTEQQSNSTPNLINMVFPRTMTAANSDQNFDVVNEGIWLTEEHLNNIEHFLNAEENNSAELRESYFKIKIELDNLNNINSSLLLENASLKQKVSELESLSAPVSSTCKEEDLFLGSNAPNYSHNEWVDSLLGSK